MKTKKEEKAPTNSCVFPSKYVVVKSAAICANRARNDTYLHVLLKIKEKIFSLICLTHFISPRKNCFKQFLTPGTKGLNLSRGLPGARGNGNSQIEPCISSHFKLFAGDTLLYAVIHSQADALSLQSARVWQMNFHTHMCYVLRIHRSKNPIAINIPC